MEDHVVRWKGAKGMTTTTTTMTPHTVMNNANTFFARSDDKDEDKDEDEDKTYSGCDTTTIIHKQSPPLPSDDGKQHREDVNPF